MSKQASGNAPFGYLSRLISRIRHFRGHGIHSPFVYSLVRSVFTGRGESADENRIWSAGMIYDTLRGRGLDAKTSRRIERFHAFCGCGGFTLGFEQGAEMCIILPGDDFRPDMVPESTGTVFVVAEPYADKRKIADCLTISSKYGRLTIDSYRFFIIFDIEREPKRHFRI